MVRLVLVMVSRSNNSFKPNPHRGGLIQALGAMKAPPFPIAALSLVQTILGLVVAGAMAYWLATEGFVGIDEIPAWIMPVALLTGLACIASAVQLWRLRWSGPISFLALWLLPFFGSLPFASPMEIIRDASFIEGRLAFLLVYGVIVFEFRRQFAPNKSFNPTPLRGAG